MLILIGLGLRRKYSFSLLSLYVLGIMLIVVQSFEFTWAEINNLLVHTTPFFTIQFWIVSQIVDVISVGIGILLVLIVFRRRQTKLRFDKISILLLISTIVSWGIWTLYWNIDNITWRPINDVVKILHTATVAWIFVGR